MTSVELDAIMKRAEAFQTLYHSDSVPVDDWKRLAAEAHNDRDALLLVMVDDPNKYVQRMVRVAPASNVVQFPEPQANEVQLKKNQTVILSDDIQKYGFDEAVRRAEKR